MYNVVFEYKESESAGCRFRVSFPSQESFVNREADPSHLKVVADGVSEEESLRLCEEVEASVLFKGAMAQSRGVNGSIDPLFFQMEMMNVHAALYDRIK